MLKDAFKFFKTHLILKWRIGDFCPFYSLFVSIPFVFRISFSVQFKKEAISDAAKRPSVIGCISLIAFGPSSGIIAATTTGEGSNSHGNDGGGGGLIDSPQPTFASSNKLQDCPPDETALSSSTDQTADDDVYEEFAKVIKTLATADASESASTDTSTQHSTESTTDPWPNGLSSADKNTFVCLFVSICFIII